jgi:hypothetical protein
VTRDRGTVKGSSVVLNTIAAILETCGGPSLAPRLTSPKMGGEVMTAALPCMPKFVRTATSHWYRCVYSMPKLLILLLRSLRSGEIRHFCAPSFFSISLAKE